MWLIVEYTDKENQAPQVLLQLVLSIERQTDGAKQKTPE